MTPDQRSAAVPLYISCGCIWDGDTRTLACPAHNRIRIRKES